MSHSNSCHVCGGDLTGQSYINDVPFCSNACMEEYAGSDADDIFSPEEVYNLDEDRNFLDSMRYSDRFDGESQ